MQHRTDGGMNAGGARLRIALPLASLLLIGGGYCLFVPPFENFDENGHYSSVLQVAGTGEIPVHGRAFMERRIAEYQGPTAYGTGAPPFDRHLTYRKFFADPAAVEPYVARYRTPGAAMGYEKSDQPNWVAQHPPLYYLLLAPLVKPLDGLPYVDRLLVLRIVSWIVASAGVWLGMLAATRGDRNPENLAAALLGFAVYPLALPMFFPEFARLGNDSLCLFLVGLLAYLWSSARGDELGAKPALLAGITLGVGLLTKAFFLPISAGVIVFLFARALAARSRPDLFRSRLVAVACVVGPALVLGSGWYAYQYVSFGSLSGSDESIQLARQGGMLVGLRNHFSFAALTRGLAAIVASFIWAGTWSLTRLPEPFLLPLVLLLGLVVVGAIAAARGKSPLSLAALPWWVLAFFAAGLAWHLCLSIARIGVTATPGWYVHILMPWLAPLFGVGLAALWKTKLRLPVLLLVVYAVGYQLVAVWAHLTLYSGCSVKGDDKHFVFAASPLCLPQVDVVLDNLSVLAYPRLGLALFFGGLALQSALVYLALKRLPSTETRNTNLR